MFDPLLVVNVSPVDPLPHQIEAVYSYALRYPKTHFLIADDAGAGKTIMADLLVKDLQYRKMAKRSRSVLALYRDMLKILYGCRNRCVKAHKEGG